MAAQLEQVQALEWVQVLEWVQALERREPIFPVLAVAGLLAPGQQGSGRSASGVQQGQMPGLKEMKEQTGTKAQNKRESQCNGQGKEPGIPRQCRKKVIACKRKLDKGGEVGL
ncbi:hypothetical protein WISP_78812 [Willisornis vidua]|uniref:Uncharacterized protein n=1 Tax=Willisornis vidua TaxID=1566151 RepID=A0ABQ9D5C9_9PASS|nr:hypothetical protein WISP_78812 [Willisornis vidua]